MDWGDLRTIADTMIGLILMKGLLEPAAAWAFKASYEKADELSGDQLPDLPEALGGDPEPPEQP